MKLREMDGAEQKAGVSQSWAVGLTSIGFAVLQSVCTAVMAISGLRLAIGITSLAAASVLPSFLFALHTQAIRIPMLAFSVIGSAVNLFVLWRIRSIRKRPESQWRARPISSKQKRAETVQFFIAILTLLLVALESFFHHHLHGSY